MGSSDYLGDDKSLMDKTIFQNSKGHAGGLDIDRWCVRKRGIKKGSLLEDLSG